MSNPLSIVLFLTSGSSLEQWAKAGTLNRELAIYRELLNLDVQVSILSYGKKTENQFVEQIKPINLLYNQFNLPAPLYTRSMFITHRKYFQNSSLIKTNQMSGSEYASRVAVRFNKPLIVRCGYSLSKNVGNEFGKNSNRYLNATSIEKNAYYQANKILLSTKELKGYVTKEYPSIEDKISIHPNYVETEKFKPDPTAVKEKRLIYIGRLHSLKNLMSLIDAVKELDVELEIIGSGPQKDELKAKVTDCDRIFFSGKVENDLLPKHINRCMGFILPSLWEGHPKSLIEAMSCGVPVIGTNVSGTRTIIQHKKNGLLCETETSSIRQAIETLLGSEQLRNRLGTAAREYVQQNYSLSKLVKKEFQIYQEVIDQFKNAN